MVYLLDDWLIDEDEDNKTYIIDREHYYFHYYFHEIKSILILPTGLT
jgi:hypothetical protein